MNGAKLVNSEGVHELISVPLDSRPSRREVRPYLRNLQAYILGLSNEVLEVASEHENSMSAVSAPVQRLVTALANDLEYVRIPVVWGIWKSLCEVIASEEGEGVPDAGLQKIDTLCEVTGVFLAQFDLAVHLNEASKRALDAEDKIDNAFFLELDRALEAFDEERSAVFADRIERTQRITAVLDLPSGASPKLTYFSMRILAWLDSKLLPLIGRYALAFGTVYLLLATSESQFTETVLNAVHHLVNWVAD